MSNKDFIPVSIIMPMRNASTTVLRALESIVKQKYPIREIIIIDNASKDNSVKVVEDYSKKSRIPIHLTVRNNNKGVGANFNFGVKNAKSSLVILMHSDCFLPTENELGELIEPMRKNPTVLATFSTVDLPMHIWNTYSFWEKCLFSRLAGKGHAGATTKFDCIRKTTFLNVGGFDMRNFGMGGEDMDLAQKICALGEFILSDAKATHLHFLGAGFTFKEFLRKKKQYAMIYGRLLRRRPRLFLGKAIIFLIKPFLAIIPFLPVINIVGIPIVFLYGFSITQRMFLTKSSYSNWRIILLPFINILLIYYETFWMIESFLFGENKIE